MTLIQQLLIISILPLSFLAMVGYLWRTETRRRHVFRWWMITLTLATIWASSILRLFGGTEFSLALRFNWGLIGTYAFTLMMLAVLVTTFVHIRTAVTHNRVSLILGVLLWGGAFALEPRAWPYTISDITIAGQVITHFNLWFAVWVASWLIPLLAAFISVQRINASIPRSLYRNQVQYWLLTLLLFFIGAILNSIHQPRQPGWQQLGLLVSILAALAGTFGITQSYLPDLRLGVRQLLSRLSGSLLVFGFTLVTLFFLIRLLTNLPQNNLFLSDDPIAETSLVILPAENEVGQESQFIVGGRGTPGMRFDIFVNGERQGGVTVDSAKRWAYDLVLPAGTYDIEIMLVDSSAFRQTAVSAQNIIITLAAALFTGLFILIFRLTNRLTQRLLLPTLGKHKTIAADYENAAGYLPDPEQLAQLFLRVVQSNLGCEDVWFFTTEDEAGGRLALRPLTSIGSTEPESIDFDHESPIAHYFRQNNAPLVQYDIDTLDAFANIDIQTRETLADWQRILYLPMQAGQTLVGILALGSKLSGESYDRQDFEMLTSLTEQLSPLFRQAQNLRSIRHINDYIFQQNQRLGREKQHLHELVGLYTQFIKMISPELRRPFTSIDTQLQKLEELPEQKSTVAELNSHVTDIKASIDDLIALSGRIKERNQFDFEMVRMDMVAQLAIRKLTKMAEARRVNVELNVQTALPPVLGDKDQLYEAVYYLLHNAIKFNKIGGTVQIDCGIEGSDLYLRVIDSGVGLPEDRLNNIWAGLSSVANNGNSLSPRKSGGRSYRRGAGIGLALTRFIVAAHGGRVDAISKYGSGSTFAIYLPLLLEE